MKTILALVSALIPALAFAHESTAPHAHPHDASLLPDYGLALIAAALVACAVLAVRIWRKG